jgi:hypothetical protein
LPLDFSEFPIVYQVAGVVVPFLSDDATSEEQARVTVANAGKTDQHVRAVIRQLDEAVEGGSVVFDDSAITSSETGFDLVKTEGLEVWTVLVPPGVFWFQVYVTAATLIPSIDVRTVKTNPGGTRSLLWSTACYTGDFAVTYQHVRVIGGIMPGTIGGIASG